VYWRLLSCAGSCCLHIHVTAVQIGIFTFGRQTTFYHDDDDEDDDDDDDDDDHHHYKIEDKVKTTLPKVGDNEETEYVGLDVGPLERSRRTEVMILECDLKGLGVRALAGLN
jgi:hypothetical protein